MNADAVIKAVVQKVVPGGTHGPFAVATSEGLDGSVTFSLEPTIWQEKEWPEEGMYVLLGKLRKKRAGWRAKTGRFFKPSDEQTERSSEMKKKHPENLSALRRYYTETAVKVAPNLHKNSQVEWVIHDLGGDWISVRCIYKTSYVGRKQFENEHKALIEALQRDQEVLGIPLKVFMGWYGSSIAGSEEVSINYGKEYKLSTEDLPANLEAERNSLRERRDKIRRAQEILKNISEQLSLSSVEGGTTNLEFRLREASQLCTEVKYSEFEKDLVEHQTRIIAYLGILETDKVSRCWWGW